MPQTFTLVPEYEYIEEDVYKTFRTEMLGGYVQTRAYWQFPKRLIKLKWDAATQAEKEEAISFFRDHRGAASSFTYAPKDPIASPHRAGDQSQVAGGALALRTYYWAITWSTTGGQTRPCATSSNSVSANTLFKLVIPKFTYRTVTKANIYVGTTANNMTKQAEVTTSGGSWTEPSGGLVAGDAITTANTATESLTVHLLNESFLISKRTPVSYGMEMEFEEVF